MGTQAPRHQLYMCTRIHRLQAALVFGDFFFWLDFGLLWGLWGQAPSPNPARGFLQVSPALRACSESHRLIIIIISRVLGYFVCLFYETSVLGMCSLVGFRFGEGVYFPPAANRKSSLKTIDAKPPKQTAPMAPEIQQAGPIFRV